MLIGVIAGTAVDTGMGMDFVVSKGHEAIGRALSKSPEEQNEMQILHKDELLEVFIRLCNEMVDEGVSGIFVNCNSLSGAIDMNYARKRIPVNAVTPMDVYEKVAKMYKRICVIAANGQSLGAIEKTLLRHNNRCIIFGAAIMPLVIEIEEGRPPFDIYKSLKLKELTESLLAMDCQALILGCTHFPYISKELEKDFKRPIINPEEGMLKLLLG